MPARAELETHPLTPERWRDLEALFGPNGADEGCWCMYWRLRARAYAANDREQNKAALRARVQARQAPGLLAYRAGEPAGWIGLSPREQFARLARSRHFPAGGAAPVWGVVCFFVGRAHRGRGVAAALLRAGLDCAAAQGARTVEGYPLNLRRPEERLQARAAYPGTTRLFRAAGFELAAITPALGSEAQRVVMRYEVPGG